MLAVNKIDLVDFDERVFRDIVSDYRKFAEPLGFRSLFAIPISARFGDNVSLGQPKTPWYQGAASARASRNASTSRRTAASAPFRLPVQWVNRPHLDFRGFAGTIAERARRRAASRSSSPDRGSRSTVDAHPRRRRGDVDSAEAGDAVTLTLDRRGRHCPRRRACRSPTSRPEVADQFAAHVIWMSADAMLPGRSYLMKIGARTSPAQRHRAQAPHRRQQSRASSPPRRSPSTRSASATSRRPCRSPSTPMPTIATPAPSSSSTAATNETAAAGMIAHGLRRATNVHRHGLVGRRASAHAAQKHQKPAILWFTGLSGAGKSTIANLVEAKLHARGVHTDAARRRQRAPRPQQGSWVSPTPTGSRTSAASARWRG